MGWTTAVGDFFPSWLMTGLNFGMAYPKGDQDELFALGDAWKHAAAELEKLEPTLKSTTDRVPQYYTGDGATAATTEFATLFDGGEHSIQKLIEGLQGLGHDARSTATEIEFAKIQAEIFAVMTLWTVISLMSSLIGSTAVPGYLLAARGVLAKFAAEVSARIGEIMAESGLKTLAAPLVREIIVPIGERIAPLGERLAPIGEKLTAAGDKWAALNKTIADSGPMVRYPVAALKGGVHGGLMGAGLDAGTQIVQIMEGHRDDGFNLKQTFQTSLQWGAGGLLGGPTGELAGRSLMNRALKDPAKELPKWLGGTITGGASGVAGATGMYGAGLATQLYDNNGDWNKVNKSFSPQLLIGGLAMGTMGGSHHGLEEQAHVDKAADVDAIAKQAPVESAAVTKVDGPQALATHQKPSDEQFAHPQAGDAAQQGGGPRSNLPGQEKLPNNGLANASEHRGGQNAEARNGAGEANRPNAEAAKPADAGTKPSDSGARPAADNSARVANAAPADQKANFVASAQDKPAQGPVARAPEVRAPGAQIAAPEAELRPTHSGAATQPPTARANDVALARQDAAPAPEGVRPDQRTDGTPPTRQTLGDDAPRTEPPADRDHNRPNTTTTKPETNTRTPERVSKDIAADTDRRDNDPALDQPVAPLPYVEPNEGPRAAPSRNAEDGPRRNGQPRAAADDVGDFRGDARPHDRADLTRDELLNQIEENLDGILPEHGPDGNPDAGSPAVRWDPEAQRFLVHNELTGRELEVHVDVGTLSHPDAVAEFHRAPDESGYRITVSDRARTEDVARAVAYELAEIRLEQDPNHRPSGLPREPHSSAPEPVETHPADGLPAETHPAEGDWSPRPDDDWSRMSPQEISDELVRRWGVETVGFDHPNLQPEVVREFARAVDDMLTRYPDVDLPRLVIEPMSEEYYAEAVRQITPDGRAHTDKLVLNELHALDPEAMTRDVADDEADGHLVPASSNRPIHSTLVHEFAHAIYFEGQQRSGVTAHTALRDYYETTRGGMDAGFTEWVNQLSDYSFNEDGRFNAGEALAEAFTDVEYNGQAATEPAKVLYWHLLDSANQHSIAPNGFTRIPEDIIPRPNGPYAPEQATSKSARPEGLPENEDHPDRSGPEPDAAAPKPELHPSETKLDIEEPHTTPDPDEPNRYGRTSRPDETNPDGSAHKDPEDRGPEYEPDHPREESVPEPQERSLDTESPEEPQNRDTELEPTKNDDENRSRTAEPTTDAPKIGASPDESEPIRSANEVDVAPGTSAGGDPEASPARQDREDPVAEIQPEQTSSVSPDGKTGHPQQVTKIRDEPYAETMVRDARTGGAPHNPDETPPAVERPVSETTRVDTDPTGDDTRDMATHHKANSRMPGGLITFDELSPKVKHLVNSLADADHIPLRPGEVNVGHLAELQQFSGVEHAVVQNAKGDLRLFRGDQTSSAIPRDLRGEYHFVLHTHPEDRLPGPPSEEERRFGRFTNSMHKDLDYKHSPHIEAVVSRDGQVRFFTNEGILDVPAGEYPKGGPLNDRGFVVPVKGLGDNNPELGTKGPTHRNISPDTPDNQGARPSGPGYSAGPSPESPVRQVISPEHPNRESPPHTHPSETPAAVDTHIDQALATLENPASIVEQNDGAMAIDSLADWMDITDPEQQHALEDMYQVSRDHIAPFIVKVADDMLTNLKAQVAENPNLKVVFVGRDGHSLGLAMTHLDPQFVQDHGHEVTLSRAVVETAVQDLENNAGCDFPEISGFRNAAGKVDPTAIDDAYFRLTEYFHDLGIPMGEPGSEIALVDTSYKGTVQELLNAIYPETGFEGHYMFYSASPADVHVGNKIGYALDLGVDEGNGGLPVRQLPADRDLTFSHQDALGTIEEIMHGPLGSPKGIGSDGLPAQNLQRYESDPLEGLNPATVADRFADPLVREAAKRISLVPVVQIAHHIAELRANGIEPHGELQGGFDNCVDRVREWIEGGEAVDPKLNQVLDSFVRRGDKGQVRDLTKLLEQSRLDEHETARVWREYADSGPTAADKKAFVERFNESHPAADTGDDADYHRAISQDPADEHADRTPVGDRPESRSTTAHQEIRAGIDPAENLRNPKNHIDSPHNEDTRPSANTPGRTGEPDNHHAPVQPNGEQPQPDSHPSHPASDEQGHHSNEPELTSEEQAAKAACDQLPHPERNALNDYAGDAYNEINRHLRFGEELHTVSPETIDLIRSGLDKLPDHAGPVKRSLMLSPKDLERFWYDNHPGAKVEDPGFVSTSKTKFKWNPNVELTIVSATGKDISFLQPLENRGEAEVLISDGRQFRVLDRRMSDDGTLRIKWEEITDSPRPLDHIESDSAPTLRDRETDQPFPGEYVNDHHDKSLSLELSDSATPAKPYESTSERPLETAAAPDLQSQYPQPANTHPNEYSPRMREAIAKLVEALWDPARAHEVPDLRGSFVHQLDEAGLRNPETTDAAWRLLSAHDANLAKYLADNHTALLPPVDESHTPAHETTPAHSIVQNGEHLLPHPEDHAEAHVEPHTDPSEYEPSEQSNNEHPGDKPHQDGPDAQAHSEIPDTEPAAEPSPDEHNAVHRYTDPDADVYSDLNHRLRSGLELDPEQQKLVADMASGLEKLPAYDGTVWRGTHLKPEQLARYVPGARVTEPSFTSTSRDPRRIFASNVEFIVHSETGRDISAISARPGEKEVLFKPGTTFEVRGVVKDPNAGLFGITRIYLYESSEHAPIHETPADHTGHEGLPGDHSSSLGGDAHPSEELPIRHGTDRTALGDSPEVQRVYDNVRNEGEHDVVVHGDRFGKPTTDDNFEVDPQRVVEAIRNNPNYVEGTPIRLLSCHSGNDIGWAQHVANELGVPVRAPSDLVGVRAVPDSPAILHNATEWRTFHPTEADGTTLEPTVHKPTDQPDGRLPKYEEDPRENWDILGNEKAGDETAPLSDRTTEERTAAESTEPTPDAPIISEVPEDLVSEEEPTSTRPAPPEDRATQPLNDKTEPSRPRDINTHTIDTHPIDEPHPEQGPPQDPPADQQPARDIEQRRRPDEAPIRNDEEQPRATEDCGTETHPPRAPSGDAEHQQPHADRQAQPVSEQRDQPTGHDPQAETPAHQLTTDENTHTKQDDDDVVPRPVTEDELLNQRGMPLANQRAFQRICEEFNYVMDVRPTTPSAVHWLEEGAIPKPKPIKAKSINEFDVYLGAPEDKIGLVGFFEPEMPAKADVPPELWDKVSSRYAERLNEWNRDAEKMAKFADKNEFFVEDKVVYGFDKDTGEPRPLTGDHDLFDIRKPNGDRLSLEEVTAVTNRMVDENMGAMHGPHRYWPEMDPPVNEDIYQKTNNSHGPGGEPLIRFSPDAGPVLVDSSTPVPHVVDGPAHPETDTPVGLSHDTSPKPNDTQSAREKPFNLPEDNSTPRSPGAGQAPKPETEQHQEPAQPHTDEAPAVDDTTHPATGSSEHARPGKETEAGVSFHPDDEVLSNLAEQVPKDPNHFTADVHIDETGNARIGDRTYTPEEFGDLLRRSGWDGKTPIRLIGCDAATNGFAARLAAHLDVDVLAPTKPAWSDTQGRLYTSTAESHPDGTRRPRIPPDGEWETHHPDGTKTRAADDGFAPGTHDEHKNDLEPIGTRDRATLDPYAQEVRDEARLRTGGRDALDSGSPARELTRADVERIERIEGLRDDLNRPGVDPTATKAKLRAELEEAGVLREGKGILRNDGPAMQRRALMTEAGLDFGAVADEIGLRRPPPARIDNEGLPLRGEHADPAAVPRRDVTFAEVDAIVPDKLIQALEKFGVSREVAVEYIVDNHNDRSRQRYLPDLEGLARQYGIPHGDVLVIDQYTTKLYYEELNRRLRDNEDVDSVAELQQAVNDSLSKLPPAAAPELYRSLSFKPRKLTGFLTEYTKDAVIDWNAFTSVAGEVGGTWWEQPGENILFKIRGGVAYDISDFADGLHYKDPPNPGRELLLPAGMVVRVEKVTPHVLPDGTTGHVIELQVVGSTRPTSTAAHDK
ncbi:MAG: putative NAD(+)--arginine ADP-ribosyltransferase [Nocardia sp.]|uniref:ADP-ribosyltransferase n=1 Tax=Nocardia sp. TaxID=1821 RepID=UPI00263223F4|nr:ADP-ribosyltransferase [Nocardia sp.]MCU1643424.1 putative NAD(+)--arginine ADP-ribosyltransferase [Nocardia sp.]